MKTQTNKKLEHPIGSFIFDKDGILHATAKPVPRTMEVMLDFFDFLKKIIGDRKVCIICDITYSTPMDPETSRYADIEFQKLFNAMALITYAAETKTAGKVFLQLEKNSYPLKMFSDEESALLWLKRYL